MKLIQKWCVFILCAGLSLHADEPNKVESVRAAVEDVTESGRGTVLIRVFYESPAGVSARSFDDADLWVSSAGGFHSGVTFLRSDSLIPLPGPNGDIPPVAQAVGVYELAAPEGGWTRDHNGEYAVMLAGGEVARNDGSHFDLALAGSFRVAIDDEKNLVPVLSGGVRIETFPTPGVPGGNVSELVVATFTATFPHPVEVNWGEVSRSATGGFCVEVEGCAPDELVPQVLTTYTHRVELGMLGPGRYSAALKAGDGVLAREGFEISGGGGDLLKGVPSDVVIDIVELPSRGLYPVFAANVKLTFHQYVDHVDWGDVERKGEILTSDFSAWIDSRILIVAPMVVEHQVYLGMLMPGEYRYELSSLDQVMGRAEIVVPGEPADLQPPTVTVRGATVTEAGNEPLEFSIEFFDESELVVDGIRSQVLSVMNRRGERVELKRISLDLTADFSAGAIATYRMEPPGGSWGSEDRGRYRLLLSEPALVSDRLGNHLRSPLIGYVTVGIDPDSPGPIHKTELTITNNELIGRWTAAVRLFVPEELAVRDDWSVDWGEVRPTGPAFFLRPRFVRAGSNEEIDRVPPSDTTGAGIWVRHDYDLGPISRGDWLVCLNSNLGHFAKGRLLAAMPDGPNEPFPSWENWADRRGNLSEGRLFWEYCVGTDPGNPADDHEGDPRPEVIDGEDGRKHLALRCQIATEAIDARFRFEGSPDMNTWIELGADRIEEVERFTRRDGVEEFLVCLVDDIGTSEIRYLRVVAERW